jgi:hypothetical protein
MTYAIELINFLVNFVADNKRVVTAAVIVCAIALAITLMALPAGIVEAGPATGGTIFP